MSNPYETLPTEAFWRPAVADAAPFRMKDLWRPKFEIRPSHKVATFGSCFAQHIGRALRKRNYNWLDTEPAPNGLSSKNAQSFNYGVFSCRTANIYTTSLLLQWTKWALGELQPPEEFWQNENRFIDPFRPTIEPDNFASKEELLISRAKTIAAFRKAIKDSDYFVFTLGLTESWFNSDHGYEYPICPGVAGGYFDPSNHKFVNQHFSMVLDNMRQVLTRFLSINENIRVILTVSPVPLTATNSRNHVLVASTESKSVLRAVAGQLSRNWKNIDYFCSYELISSPAMRGMFYSPNLRTVEESGVEFVMDTFFKCLNARFGMPKINKTSSQSALSSVKVEEGALVCEEELLDAFSTGKQE